MAKGQRLLAARRGDKLITKEELKSHVRLVQEIADLKENITRLQLQAESISATRISGAPSGSGSPDSQPYQQGDYVVWRNPDSSRKKLK